MRAVNIRILKPVVAVILGILVGAVFLYQYPFPFSLAWPGLALARIGVPHSWLFAAAVMVGLLIWLAISSRNRAWWQTICISLLVSGTYCALAQVYLARLPVPLPATTPYDTNAARRAAYLQSYDSGYRDGMAGVRRTYCFYPEAETRGFYEGAHYGSEVWYRLLGRQMPERRRRLTEISAGRDGARVELTNGTSQDGAANGSLPVVH